MARGLKPFKSFLTAFAVLSSGLAGMIGFTTLAFASATSVHTPTEMTCQLANHGDDSLTIEVCNYSTSEYLVRVRTFDRSPKSLGVVRTEVNALYTKGNQIWNRVWISQGEGSFTAREQNYLREIVAKAPTVLVDSHTLAFLSLLSDFLTPDTPIENFDAATESPGSLPRVWSTEWTTARTTNAFGSWTPICELIGRPLIAQYVLPGAEDKAPSTSVWTVGDPATYCKGRCGWGCAQKIPQRSKNQYTQECFDHDACYSDTGALLGVCKKTFWIAAASYVFAPNCPQSSPTR